jgi:hypothetical protein
MQARTHIDTYILAAQEYLYKWEERKGNFSNKVQIGRKRTEGGSSCHLFGISIILFSTGTDRRFHHDNCLQSKRDRYNLEYSNFYAFDVSICFKFYKYLIKSVVSNENKC